MRRRCCGLRKASDAQLVNPDAFLDRPVWHMLAGRQAHLALGDAKAKRIDPGYGPLAARRAKSAGANAALRKLVRGPANELWLVETEPAKPPQGFQVKRMASVLQMIAGDLADEREAFDREAMLLGEADVEAMTALVEATRPGPWGPLTHRYGPFYGIFREGRLAAMAGQRMLPGPGLAEVSGVCTWPEFQGQGLAARLIRHVMAGMRARGDRPFLHTYAENGAANGLYHKLGFRERRTMFLTVLEPTV